MNALVCNEPRALQSYFRMPALPPGQIREFLTMAKSITPGVIGLDAEWHFYVDVRESLSKPELGRLIWLLAETFQPKLFAPKSFLGNGARDGFLVEIGPRQGTVTDWSSNMETICRACGLGKVERIERFRRLKFWVDHGELTDSDQRLIVPGLFDRMTEQVYASVLTTFDPGIVPTPVRTIPLIRHGVEALREFARTHNLKFLPEIESYIMSHFIKELMRDPTDVELFDFGQLNSPHCRHHEFTGEWEINGVPQKKSLMDWIKGTVKTCGMGNLAVAFTDNAAITVARPVWALVPRDPRGPSPFVLIEVERGDSVKVETHNHPTGIDPEKGAATGVAVDRDNMGSGRGGVPEDHTACYYVAHLMIKDYPLPWEQEYVQHPRRFATPRVILTKASDGASANANCRGIPVTNGSTTSFELVLNEGAPDAFRLP
jgi:phosphoribosylformylglycinamidine synthase